MFGHKWFLKLGELSDASITALMNDASELIYCNYSLYQGVDEKGQAQTNVRVSDITATYDGLPSQEIIEWALDSRRYLNGSLVLSDANDMPVKKLFFQDGACVSLHLNFSSAGKSSIITQIRIKPRRLVIDEDSIDQNWISFPALMSFPSANGINNLAKKAFKLSQPLSKLSLDLVLEGTTYEIENFGISFEQPHDFRGQPQELVHGGAITFTIPSMADQKLTQWMMRSEMLKNGMFVFKRGDQSSPLKIAFDEAYCINMTNRTASSKGLSTDFVISANEIRMNDKACCNNFKL